ncbi:MAG TPA: acyl-CoA dehydrogenase [Actinomycetes bacterium]|nr:acyl-CoA dehydrogenase [Actinomycetes bacterium]
MGHYKANLRDIEFTLFEVLGRQSVLGQGPYADLDEDTARSILTEIERLSTHELADSLLESDRTPPVFDPATHSVHIPDGFRRSYEAYRDGGWQTLDLPAELDGQPTPPSLRWAVAEMILGSNPAVHMYSTGTAFAHVLYRLGTEEQQGWAKTWASKRWGSTMVLTEPDAGSDVGAGTARALPQPDGSWHIEGVKRFITSGEHDLEENIIHLVLARPYGVPGVGGPGTKGLSLFVVPKFLVDWETGELGERNGVFATNVEHKMGLKASSTCELRFGETIPAKGWLVGDVHEGIAQMFKIIESARMMVGTKAIATLSTAYLNALDYAKTRVQGADLTQAADKTAPRVTITHHADVRRSLITQKAYAEGMRALVLYTASIQDDVALGSAEGRDVSADEALNDLLLPIVKGYGSEKSYGLIGQEALQCFGGSGYLQDYPLEQYVRDAKIDTLYEGTTAIQGQDLFFRKIVKDQGRALTRLLTDVAEFAKGEAGNGHLARERDLLGSAVEDVQGIVGAMVGQYASAQVDVRNVYKVGLNTTRLLFALGDLVCSWLLLRQAEVALAALDHGASGREGAFYEGKVAAARWFARQVLPLLAVQRQLAEETDNDVMDLPEDAF